jgi:hypothetical protein
VCPHTPICARAPLERTGAIANAEMTNTELPPGGYGLDLLADFAPTEMSRARARRLLDDAEAVRLAGAFRPLGTAQADSAAALWAYYLDSHGCVRRFRLGDLACLAGLLILIPHPSIWRRLCPLARNPAKIDRPAAAAALMAVAAEVGWRSGWVPPADMAPRPAGRPRKLRQLAAPVVES